MQNLAQVKLVHTVPFDLIQMIDWAVSMGVTK